MSVFLQFSPTQVGQWGDLANKLTVVFLLAIYIVTMGVALYKEWLVVGTYYRSVLKELERAREETQLWRDLYLDLRHTTKQATVTNKEFAEMFERVVKP